MCYKIEHESLPWANKMPIFHFTSKTNCSQYTRNFLGTLLISGSHSSSSTAIWRLPICTQLSVAHSKPNTRSKSLPHLTTHNLYASSISNGCRSHSLHLQLLSFQACRNLRQQRVKWKLPPTRTTTTPTSTTTATTLPTMNMMVHCCRLCKCSAQPTIRPHSNCSWFSSCARCARWRQKLKHNLHHFYLPKWVKDTKVRTTGQNHNYHYIHQWWSFQ